GIVKLQSVRSEGVMTTVETSFEKVRRKLLAARIEFMGQLAKFSKKELTQQPADNAWSPLQLAYHLYIADGLALEQMRRVQDEDAPLLDGLAARREELFEYLSSLPEDAWVRPYRSSEQEERKFYQLVNILPYHEQ